MGYKIQESQLRGLGTESSTPGTKDYVFLYRVRPGSVPDDVPSDRVVWATWKELTKARSTGYLATGNHIQYPLRHEYFGKPIDEYINSNVRLAGENPTSTLCMSGSGSKLLTLEGSVRGSTCKILIDSGASENFASTTWVHKNNIPRISGSKYRIRLADGSLCTSTHILHGEVLTMGERDYQLSAVCTDLDKFDIILGQPWLEVVNPDIDWTTKTVRDRKSGWHHPGYR